MEIDRIAAVRARSRASSISERALSGVESSIGRLNLPQGSLDQTGENPARPDLYELLDAEPV